MDRFIYAGHNRHYAIRQTNFKRLLAYSGIANVGFVLISLLAINDLTASYILYNLLAYGISSILAFSIYATIKTHTEIDTIEGLAGLMANNKLLAISLIFAMLSFAGIPPLAGFFGKYFIIVNAVNNEYVWLAVIAVLSSVIAAYNYLRVSAIIVSHTSTIASIPITTMYRVFLIVCCLCIIVLGILPEQVLGLLG
jgi:NADH-quinone oxidoreductase subunit N